MFRRLFRRSRREAAERYESELIAFTERTLSLPTSLPETKSRYGDIIAPLPGMDSQVDDVMELFGGPIEEQFDQLAARALPQKIREALKALDTALAAPSSAGHGPVRGSLFSFMHLAYCWREAELLVFRTGPAQRVQKDVAECVEVARSGHDGETLARAAAEALGRGIAFEFGVVTGALGPELTRLGMTKVSLRYHETFSKAFEFAASHWDDAEMDGTSFDELGINLDQVELDEASRWNAFTCGLALRHAEIALDEAR